MLTNILKMTHYSLGIIQTWERFYRANFINSLSGYKSASLIGTCNLAGQTNLAIFSNIVHLGADPALVAFINRPLAAAPHTIANILATKQFTINHIPQQLVQQAHQTSAKYDATVSEFDATHLTPIYKANCIAPFVQECTIQYSLNLVEVVPIIHNNTSMVIGAVQDVYVITDYIEKDGFIAIEKADSIASLGIDGYYACQRVARLAYAQVGIESKVLSK